MGPRCLQQCENFFDIIVLQFCGLSTRLFYGGANSNLLQKDLCHMAQVPGLLQPEPPSLQQAMLIRASTGDTQTLKGRSSIVSCGVSGSWFAQGFI